MANDPVVLIDAELAEAFCACKLDTGDAVDLRIAMNAIATGRTVVVPRISEAEAREAFVKWWNAESSRYAFSSEERAWLAALCYAGVLK